MNSIDDTIVAPATPIGEGGISIVRLSGKESIDIADKCFRGKVILCNASTHTVHHGKFYSIENAIIDDVLATVFRAPNSYTGEDTIEISCHGSIFIVEQIMLEITKAGARIAEPGEFTKRAFLNGKIDLSRAEAVADLIHSRTQISHQVSMNQLQGSIQRKIDKLRERLIDFCSFIELELDFADEGIEFLQREKLEKEIAEIIESIERLRKTFRSSKAIREGVNVTIIGKPNVGKSSIFNYLVADNRAIVTNIPGTTRDVIKEMISINGVLFNLSDTAGIRSSIDTIEIEGIKRSKETIKNADIIIIVSDVGDYNDVLMAEVKNEILHLKRKDSKVITVVNKVDLLNGVEKKIENHILVSAKSGEGMKELEKEIYKCGVRDNVGQSDKNIIVINSRHYSCLSRALTKLNNAQLTLRNRMSNEFIAVDVKGAIHSMEEITGIVSNEDILNNIFSKFCIGK